MPDFTYSGDETRYYPSLSLLVEPGDTVTLPEAPADGRFSPAGSTRKPVAPAPAPAPVEAPDTPEVGA